MRRAHLLFVLLTAIFAVPGRGQSMVPIPAPQSSSSHFGSLPPTLPGMWFQVPVGGNDFLITGARTLVGTGYQTIAIFRFANGFPTSPVVPDLLFGASGGPVLYTNYGIHARPGDVIAAFAYETTTQMWPVPISTHEFQLAPPGFASSLLGDPITLSACSFAPQAPSQTSVPYSVADLGLSQDIGLVEIYGTQVIKSKFGAGCYGDGVFYEEFSASSPFDLSNMRVTLTPSGTAGYDVSVGPDNGVWFPTTPAGVIQNGSAVPLGFNLTYPGGVTDTLRVYRAGVIYPTDVTGSGNGSGSTTLNKLGPTWMAWLGVPGHFTGGTLYFETDPAGSAAYATYVNVPTINSQFVNLQVAFFATGEVQYRFGNNPPITRGEVGWTSGLPDIVDPGSVDLSTTPPFSVSAGIAHDASAGPALGTAIALDTWPVATGLIGATVYGFTRFDPGIDLASFGMPGCLQYASTDVVEFWAAQDNRGTTTLTVPNDPTLNGLDLTTQGVLLDPGANAFGARTSNGLALQVGA